MNLIDNELAQGSVMNSNFSQVVLFIFLFLIVCFDDWVDFCDVSFWESVLMVWLV